MVFQVLILKLFLQREHQRQNEPGAYGHGLPLGANDDESKARIDKGWERQGFNEEVCKRVSLHREINGEFSDFSARFTAIFDTLVYDICRKTFQIPAVMLARD